MIETIHEWHLDYLKWYQDIEARTNDELRRLESTGRSAKRYPSVAAAFDVYERITELEPHGPKFAENVSLSLTAETPKPVKRAKDSAVISGPDNSPVMARLDLIAERKKGGQWNPSWERYRDVLFPSTDMYLWKSALAVKVGESSEWPRWEIQAQLMTDDYLTFEYGSKYSSFLASEHKSLAFLRSKPRTWAEWFDTYRTPREKWKAEYRHRRIWRLFQVQKSLERRIFDSIRDRPAPFVVWGGPLVSQKDGRTELVTRHHPEPMLYRGGEFADAVTTRLKCLPGRIIYITAMMPRPELSVVKLVYQESCHPPERRAQKRMEEPVSAASISWRLRRVKRDCRNASTLLAYWLTRIRGCVVSHKKPLPVYRTDAESMGSFKLCQYWHRGSDMERMLPTFAPDDNASLKLYQSSGLGRLGVSTYRSLSKHNKFFNVLGRLEKDGKRKGFRNPAPASPIITAGVYLNLKKSWRKNGNVQTAKLYIGRVIARDRHPDETNKQWAALSMSKAEDFIVKNLRSVEFGSKEWLEWTERYYSLKGKFLPLIPDGLENSAWDCDADGKHVYQLIGEAARDDTADAHVSVVDDWNDLESFTPPNTWRGQ